MQQVDMVSFVDIASKQDGFAVIRASNGEVALGLSLKEDGDLEVVLELRTCERLIAAIQQAIRVAREHE